jgi:ribulose-5-phosphate 4-epimerase/fuculose-1-phosphate aldolase
MLETICEIFQEAYRRNWITARDGNASVRYQEQDHFYITPSGIRKQTLQPDQFKKIKIENYIPSGTGSANFVSTWHILPYTEISQGLKPSGEIPLHFGLQRKIVGDVRVVLHVHPTYTVAAMRAGIELSELVKEFPELGRYTQVGKNVREVPPISEELAEATLPQLGVSSDGLVDNHIVGIKSHGVVSVDTSPWRAFEHIERLEHISKIVLASKI